MNEELLREQLYRDYRACCTSEFFLKSWDKENSGSDLDLEYANGKENVWIMPIWYSSCSAVFCSHLRIQKKNNFSIKTCL